MGERIPGHGGGKYTDIVFHDVRHSLLGMIEVAEREGYRLTFDSVLGLIRAGLSLNDFLENDERRLGAVRPNLKNTILRLIDLYGPSEVDEMCSKWTFHHLIFLGMGVTESISRMMMAVGIDYGEFKNMDYEDFKSRTGGRNRLTTYVKLQDAYRTFEEETGGPLPENRQWSPLPRTEMTRPSGVTKRELAALERKFLSDCYDSLTETFTIDELQEKLGADERYIRLILKNASENGLLETRERDVKKTRRTFEELMRWESLPEPEIIVMRFSEGLSVSEIADKMGLSRQRVSQRLNSAISRIPLSHVSEAKRYLRRFRQFKMNEEMFISIFDEHPGIFKLMTFKTRNGEQDIMHMYPRLTEDQKERFERRFSVFSLDGELVPISKKTVLEKVLFTHGTHIPLHIDEVHRRFHAFIQDSVSYEIAATLKMDERSMLGIASRSEFIISSSGNKVRYHNPEVLTEERMGRLYDLLNLEPGIYHARHIYELDPGLMREMDCLDPWELHNIIKTRVVHPHVRMGRMPELGIGVEDKNSWLRHLIVEHGPILLEEFLVFLSNSFGLHIPSMRSLIQTNLVEHLTVDNQLIASVPSISEQETEWLASILIEDIYTFDQLMDAHTGTPDFYDRFLNKFVLSKVGYTIRGGFVVREEFGSGEAYFRNLIKDQELYRIQDTPAARTQSYFKVLKDLETDLEIFRIDKDHYLNIRRLKKIGLAKDDISSKIRRLIEDVRLIDMRYFTVPVLQEMFQSDLFDLGMEKIFYERLIRLHEDIGFIPAGGGDIFYLSDDKRSLGQFFFDHLPKNDGVDVHELMERLEESYLIPFNRSKLIESIKERGAFFSQETGKAYLTKEIFLDSIY
ncbi:hypothetical protein EVJ29_13385 [Exiguobacterium sp. SH4S7]|uniref:sigma-70 family RNA polymerase sigma factor n=1 Tax=Exiguobacterium sp. SH4S7 TaxID=2510958 RepID=UPI00103E587A|nr:sigma-70 family RNA polymerase sigma factor [Exiguobacterium sp. SH4S7]TCI33875.1 hypothetical protein EVJ29_13385 [Exiguobacterium sp. SH4S7]